MGALGETYHGDRGLLSRCAAYCCMLNMWAGVTQALSADCGADRLLFFCQSDSLVGALVLLVQKWNSFFASFHDHDLLEFSRAHACFHGAVYVLVGMVGCDRGTQSLLSVSPRGVRLCLSDSDPALCGRILWWLKGRHSLPRSCSTKRSTPLRR